MTISDSDSSVAVSPAHPQRTLGTWNIVVLIIAAMTPLSLVVGTLPLGLGFGGPSTAAMCLISGAVIWVFCVGYGQMVRRINRPGGFYSYITRGLGRPIGVATGVVAAVGYTISLITAATVQAVVTRDILASTMSVHVDWRWLLVVQTAIVAIAAWHHIDFNARLLTVMVVVEVITIICLVIGIIANHGIGVLSFSTFSPHVFTIGDWQVAFIFAILCFQGYEAGAMYAPEAKRPEKTVPRALYGALVILTGTVALLAWALTGMSGAENQMRDVADQGFTGYIFATIQDNLGMFGLRVVSVLVIVAQLACSIGVTSFSARYLNGLAKDGVLPSVLAKSNRHNVPSTGIVLLAVLSIVTPLALAAVGVDPYTQLSSAGFGFGALVATTIQAIASVAVIAYFFREGRGDIAWWKTTLAPAVAAILLVVALIIEINGFAYITGQSVAWTTYIPWVLPLLWAAGAGLALYLKLRRPRVYAGLAAGDTAEEAEVLRSARLAAQE
ncbi:APC family permease [Nocardia sp. NPDC059239]|uniref:APC family permease n=1 Tax=unclassified Nocardia TaxID=2637762 RepID=UPI0036CC88DC